MVRAPCCEKMGLKKGPWTPEEDQILVSYIQRYGHGNWRALPKQAGLLRCGKSCRLRWTNYLRPDIKRGNFSKEEEETIIKLHEMLGNRWSTIASRLPGRTDNEIKNVWHTHLKKRLKPNPGSVAKVQDSMKMREIEASDVFTRGLNQAVNSFPSKAAIATDNNSNNNSYSAYLPVSPQATTSSSSDLSSATTDSSALTADTDMKDEYSMESTPEDQPEFDGNVWSEAFRMIDDLIVTEEFPSINMNYPNLHESGSSSPVNRPYNSNMDDNVDFWFNLFLKSEELPDLELPEF